MDDYHPDYPIPERVLPTKNRSRRMREGARKWLEVLVALANNRCEFCGQKIVAVRSVPGARVVKHHVEYQLGGVQLVARIATVEHLIPRSKGGTNEWKNLAACCHECNQLRIRLDLERRFKRDTIAPADLTSRFTSTGPLTYTLGSVLDRALPTTQKDQS